MVYFEIIAAHIDGTSYTKPTTVLNRRFRAIYGISARVCALIWDLIVREVPSNADPHHLLWGLMFLKIYGSEPVSAAIVRVDGKTMRKWHWIIVAALA